MLGFQTLRRMIAEVFGVSNSNLCCCVSLGRVRWLLPPPSGLHTPRLAVICRALDVRRVRPLLWPLAHHPLTLERWLLSVITAARCIDLMILIALANM